MQPGRAAESRSDFRPPARRVAVLFDMLSQSTRKVVSGIVRYANDRARGRWKLLTDKAIGLAFVSTDRLDEVDGIITNLHPQDLSTSKPVIYVRTPIADVADGPTLCSDHAAIGELAAAHLLSLGFAHLAYVGVGGKSWSHQRVEAFENAVRRGGRKPTGYVMASRVWDCGDTDDQQTREWLASLPRPCALFCADDRIAVHVASEAQEMGIVIPEELAILGVNDDDLCCSCVVPNLSSISVGSDNIGYIAAEYLERAMAGEKLEPKVLHRIRPVEVVVRGSTQVLGYADPMVCEAVRLIRAKAPTRHLTVEDLSGELQVSRQGLLRSFRIHVGRGPKEEIDRERSRALADLLLRDHRPLKQIVKDMGFASCGEMARFCRRMLGHSPSEMRKLHEMSQSPRGPDPTPVVFTDRLPPAKSKRRPARRSAAGR